MTRVRPLLLTVAGGYVLGTLPSADLASRVVTGGTVDLRREGSGNPGGAKDADAVPVQRGNGADVRGSAT